jgi:ATP-dependent DNA ligase
VVFDLLWLDGQDLTAFTYLARRHLLTDWSSPETGCWYPHTSSVPAPTCSSPKLRRLAVRPRRTVGALRTSPMGVPWTNPDA